MNWKMELTENNARLYIVEAATRSAINKLARRLSVRYDLSQIQIYQNSMYLYDYLLKDDQEYLANFEEKIDQKDITYLLQKAEDVVRRLDQEDRIFDIELHTDDRQRNTMGDPFAPCCMTIFFHERKDGTEKEPMMYYFNCSKLQWEERVQ